MTKTLDEAEQRQAVYDAICGIAAQCDGAVEKDFVGFDGADTKWGRGIATVPFERWGQADLNEAARLLARKYHGQARQILGFSVRELPIVEAQAEVGDPYWESRQNARQARRRAAASDKIALRKATDLGNGQVRLEWAKGDPDFGQLLDAVRALPQRRFDPDSKSWTAALTNEVAQLIEDFDLDANFEVRAVAAQIAHAEATKSHLTIEGAYVVLDTTKAEAFRVIPLERDYGGVTTKDAFKAYGFVWTRLVPNKWALPIEQADEELLQIARSADFRFSADVEKLCAAKASAKGEADKLRALLAQASRAKDLSELPAEFEAKVLEVLGR